ncbi:MAG: REP-associated tyrosine transposase, partial [Planktomarina sp.]
MPNYIRRRVKGGTYFFTVNLADRQSTLLVDRFVDLQNAVRTVQRVRPFVVEAWVVLPDHLHCVVTLPEGDSDYSTRWNAIKGIFTRRVRASRTHDGLCIGD